MLFLISYDVVATKRRSKLAKRLLNFGSRVQYSVFECDLNHEQLKRLKEQALACIDQEKDSLRIYALCQNCVAAIQSFGVKKGWEEEDVKII